MSSTATSLKKCRQPLLLALLVLPMIACLPAADSEDIKTSGLYAQYWIWSYADHIQVDATLKVGAGVSNEVRLSPGDSLTAYVAGAAIPMREEPCGGKCIPGIFYSYTASSTVTAADTPVRIVLQRPNELVDAPNSQILLPSPHAITEPAADAYSYNRPLSRSQEKIAVRWAPVSLADKVTARIVATCEEGDYLTREGDGLDTILLDASRVQSKAADGRCDLSVWVTLERKGAVDPAFGKGGTFTAKREQSIFIPSIP
jgi:hypothetical protein